MELFRVTPSSYEQFCDRKFPPFNHLGILTDTQIKNNNTTSKQQQTPVENIINRSRPSNVSLLKMNGSEELPNKVVSEPLFIYTISVCLISIQFHFQQDLFWCRIQQEVGDVATHLKNIIDFQQLSATKALGNLTVEDIGVIEEQMRNAVTRVRKTAAQQGKSLKDFYGSYSDEPEGFQFSIGDVRVLQTVVEAVKTCGIHKLLSLSPISGQQAASTSAPTAFTDDHKMQEWDALKTRIKFQLSKS